MNSYAELKDSEYCLRAVADLASQKELGLRRSVADNKIVAYRHADGRIVPAADVKAVSGTVKIPGLRLPDGREFARDQVKSERERGLITGYRLPGGQLVSRALTQTIQIARRRVISYRFADGTEVPRGEVHAVTAAEAGNPFLDSTGAAVQREGVAALDQAGRVLGYYSLNGENPGEWYGKAVGMLGLTGHISLNENRATWSSLYQGRHPVTGKQLTRGQPRGDRIAGHDVVFSVPKSLSLAWADAETATERAEIERAVMTAARADWDYLEDQISFARRGHTSGGPNDPYPDTSYLERTMGLVGGMWLHRTARPTEGKPADPQLHVHMQILNMTPSEDGTWHALDTTAIRYYLMSAGYVGQAVLRHETSRADGCALEWTQPVKGQAEVRGLDSRALIESFSQRHEETLGAAAAAADKINSKRAEQGLEPVAMSSQEVMDLAAHETRQKKELSKPTEELVAEVRQRKTALGFGELHRTYPTQPPREAAMTSKVAERLARGITEELNVFSPKDVMMGVAGAFRQGAPLDRLEVMARELVEGRSEGVIPLGQHTELTKRDFVRRDDGRLVPVRVALEGDAAERYTTREIVSAERAVVGDVVKRRLAAVGTVPTAVVEEVITAYPTLTSDQQRAVRGLLTDGAGVSILKSPPGKGKSFVVRPIVEAYKTVGIPVIATAVVARRATKLGREAGVEQAHRMNVSKLRSQVEGWSSPGVPLPRGCVVIVDEAEVMDVRDRAALQAHVAAAAGKVVLVGDPRQIGSIGPTAPFRELTHIAPTYELTWNWRFKDKDEANAIDALHAGDVAAYLKWKESKGQVEYAEGDDLRQAKTTMIARAVAIFLEDRDRGADCVIQAQSNLDRESINTAVRTALIARGEVAEHGLRIGKIEIAVGDTLQALKINGSVENGDPHKVIAIDHHRRTATTLDEAGGEVIFTPAYLENHVAYGYAFTGHKELGESPTENVVLVTAGSDSQWLISAVSRGAVKNTILFASRRPVGAEHHQPAEGVPEKGVQHVQLESALGRDRSKELATATELREQRRAQARVALSAGESRFGRPRPQLVPLASDQRDRDIAASVELTEAVSSGDSKRVRALVEADLTNTFVRAGVPLTPHSAAVRPEVATAEAGLEASEAAASIRTHPGAPLPEPDSRALRLAARARAQKAAQRRRDLQRQQQVEQAAEEKRLRGTVLDRDSGQVQER